MVFGLSRLMGRAREGVGFVKVALLMSKSFDIDLIAIDRASGGAVHRDVLDGPLRAGLGLHEVSVAVLIDLMRGRWAVAEPLMRFTPDHVHACCRVVDGWVARGRVGRDARTALAAGLGDVHARLDELRRAFGGES